MYTPRNNRVLAVRPLQCLFSRLITSRAKFISMMAGEKRHYFTSCKTSRIVTFDEVLLEVSTFQNKNPKQTVEPAQYGLEGTFNCVFKCDDLLCIYYVYATGNRSAPTSSRGGVIFLYKYGYIKI